MPCHQISFNVVHIHIPYYDRMMSVYLHRGFSAGSCRVLPGPSSDRGGVPAEVATGTPGRQQLMVCFWRLVGWLVGGSPEGMLLHVIARVHFAGPTFSARGHMP